jgi:hypothetical protein
MIASPQNARWGALLAFLGVFVVLFLVRADSSSAVSKAWAVRAAAQQQRQHCGDGFWWACSNSQAPPPGCRYGGRGTWNCWGGVVQHHTVKRWAHRTCSTYTYVAGNGRAINNGLYNCR